MINATASVENNSADAPKADAKVDPKKRMILAVLAIVGALILMGGVYAISQGLLGDGEKDPKAITTGDQQPATADGGQQQLQGQQHQGGTQTAADGGQPPTQTGSEQQQQPTGTDTAGDAGVQDPAATPVASFIAAIKGNNTYKLLAVAFTLALVAAAAFAVLQVSGLLQFGDILDENGLVVDPEVVKKSPDQIALEAIAARDNAISDSTTCFVKVLVAAVGFSVLAFLVYMVYTETPNDTSGTALTDNSKFVRIVKENWILTAVGGCGFTLGIASLAFGGFPASVGAIAVSMLPAAVAAIGFTGLAVSFLYEAKVGEKMKEWTGRLLTGGCGCLGLIAFGCLVYAIPLASTNYGAEL